MEEKCDAWLFYDYQGSDPIGRRILHLRDDDIHSRRWFYLIPANGVPQKLVHSIEKDALDHLPGKKRVYLSWQELKEQLGAILEDVHVIAMQYSPKNRIPTLSKVDAGTTELVKSYKKRLYSSADLVQYFEARLDSKELNSHIFAARYLRTLMDQVFTYIKDLMLEKQHITESDVQRFIYEKLDQKDLVLGRLPIVATGINSADPHYAPIDRGSMPLKRDQIIQIEIWAKEKHDYAIYADCCWVGYLGETVPGNVGRIFEVISQARDKAVAYISGAMQKKRTIHGWQVDNTARKIIEEAGYGSYFIHRTGHSLGRELYGYGANLDNLESKDERKIIPQTCFSIEPGIYLKEYGMRTQANLYVHEKGATIYGDPIQTEVVPILAG